MTRLRADPGGHRTLAGKNPSLIVTVDKAFQDAGRGCGTRVKRGRADYRPPLSGRRVPDANVIVNPNLIGDNFAGRVSPGRCGVLPLWAPLGRRLGTPEFAARFLDLVALGTIADVVRLDHSNRIFISRASRESEQGTVAQAFLGLCQVAGVASHDINASTLAFQIAPRLNAAGRLDDMTMGYVVC
ncbi:MAG: hypothetical protein CM1200mP36_01960 [Gammaproteobacteria bacterium]|nr:MAG: hypothetical protein CM1200mP36_01960 [Gammaproteobacteria bacterium]